ncbi:hypothetical protein V6N13_032774 [Hibiscus sabdariffa]|uniref:Mitochondrial carrier protein n=1 Tax=Hibiscus sabdariffa TaxID=183260 RepID=A0ABR2FC32_9ROSI
MGIESYEIGSSIDDDPCEDEHVQIVHSLPYYLMELIAAGASTTVSKTAVAPLERVKILLETRAEGFHSIGVYGSLKKIVKNEGLKGLYKANGVCIIRMLPHSIFHYMTYEQYRGFLQYKWPRVGQGPMLDILAGSAASATAFLCTYPLDLARAKYAYQVLQTFSDTVCSVSLSTDVADSLVLCFKVLDRRQSSIDSRRCIHSGLPAHRGITDIFRTVYKQAGMSGFYRGVGPTLGGILPYNVLKFYSHEELKRWVPNEDQSSIPLNLACGTLAALFGQTVMYPLDVVRRQMQIVPTLAIGLTSFDVVSRRLHFHGRRPADAENVTQTS